ncbi:hypothetical protein B0H12DRAFT_1154192 [Mycena haematopus]|nr:hypothetical protein B0H12DRAFT_1154192 [Mycena haematopus]
MLRMRPVFALSKATARSPATAGQGYAFFLFASLPPEQKCSLCGDGEGQCSDCSKEYHAFCAWRHGASRFSLCVLTLISFFV